MPDTARILTLLTDFGLRDYFVAAMKGVILGINPALRLVDISHSVPPHDIASGAFTLGHAYSCFPAGTIHLAVVDPGVGTARKAIAVHAGGQYFVAPDNGLLSWVLQREEDIVIHEITADHYFRKPVSSTFHGRDIFAPIAGWISREIQLHQFGPRLEKAVQIPIPAPKRVRDALIQGTVLAVDQFGNLITNLMPEDLPVFSPGQPGACKVLAAQKEITSFRRTYGEGQPGEIFLVPGSTGHLEIVLRNGSAASELKIGPGAAIGVVLS